MRRGQPPAVVFDCPVFVQAFLGSSGPSFACLELAREGRIILLMSRAALGEVGSVLLRPAFSRGRAEVTAERVREFMAGVAACSHLIDPVPHVFQYARDPKDEPYVDLAVAGRAALLVTRDNDLLALADPASADGRAVRERWPFLEIVTPPELLRRVASSSG